MRWSEMKFVAFDTETTGLNPLTGDRIIEIGILTFGFDPSGAMVGVQEYNRLVQPEIPIPRGVTQLTGLRDEDVAGAPLFSDLAEEIAPMFEGAIAVAHNYPFDHAFLTQELDRVGVRWVEPVASIDTVDLSRRRFPEAKSHKLGELVRRVGVQLTDAHRAVHDARACAESLAYLLAKAEIDDDLSALLAWSGGLGAPPTSPWLGLDDEGWPVFTQGPYQGDRVRHHPMHVAWMPLARGRREGAWGWRFDEPTRDWCTRFLQVRSMGRETPSLKGVKAHGWALDSCVAAPRARV